MPEDGQLDNLEESTEAPAHWSLLCAIAIGMWAGSELLAPGFYQAHDILLNVHRLFEMNQCVADLQLPCRWAPDMGFGYGVPIFNYYPPLPSYFGTLLHQLGAGYLHAVKLSLLAVFALSALGAYALANEFFGRIGAVIAAAFYTWAPYLAIDIFVRGALAEAFALAILPFVFWTAYRLVAARRPQAVWGIALAFSWCALLLAHHLVILMSAPFYLLWCGMLYRAGGAENRTALWGHFGLAHIIGGGLAAFFVVPSLLERDAIQLSTITHLFPWNQYTNNFLGLVEALFGTRPWGYGALGAPDGMSLFVGRAHWIVATGITAYLVFAPDRTRSDDVGEGSRSFGFSPRQVCGFFLAMGWISLAMTTTWTHGLWDLATPLAYLQFPWRFLGPATLGFSICCGGLVTLSGNRFPVAVGIAAISVVGLMFVNGAYFRPAEMQFIQDEKVANKSLISRTRHGAFDFLPASVQIDKLPKRGPPPDLRPARAIDPAQIDIRDAARGSNWVEFSAEVHPAEPTADALGSEALVRLNTTRFPGWRVFVDDGPVEFAERPDVMGRIHVALTPGTHTVRAEFHNTPVRAWANRISALSIPALMLWGLWLTRAGRRAPQGVGHQSP